MESEKTPMYEDLLTIKDNIITTNQPIQRNNFKNIDPNKFFVLEDDNSPDKTNQPKRNNLKNIDVLKEDNSPDKTKVTITFCCYIATIIVISIIISSLTLFYIYSINLKDIYGIKLQYIKK